MGLLRKLLAFWKAFADVLGRIQTTILLSLIYHLAVGPIGLLSQLLRRDLMSLRAIDAATFTADAPPISSTIERAQRQY